MVNDLDADMFNQNIPNLIIAETTFQRNVVSRSNSASPGTDTSDPLGQAANGDFFLLPDACVESALGEETVLTCRDAAGRSSGATVLIP